MSNNNNKAVSNGTPKEGLGKEIAGLIKEKSNFIVFS